MRDKSSNCTHVNRRFIWNHWSLWKNRHFITLLAELIKYLIVRTEVWDISDSHLSPSKYGNSKFENLPATILFHFAGLFGIVIWYMPFRVRVCLLLIFQKILSNISFHLFFRAHFLTEKRHFFQYRIHWKFKTLSCEQSKTTCNPFFDTFSLLWKNWDELAAKPNHRQNSGVFLEPLASMGTLPVHLVFFMYVKVSAARVLHVVGACETVDNSTQSRIAKCMSNVSRRNSLRRTHKHTPRVKERWIETQRKWMKKKKEWSYCMKTKS